jgi:ubiquitin C-terminal hydrolase
MFGLRNQRGSCWINAALQGVFRIPDLQTRFQEGKADTANPIEMCLEEIWKTRGADGLKDFYDCVKTTTMPAGEDIGDSHELLEFLCDKVPFLDKLMRFKIAHTVRCNNSKCTYKDAREDSMIEFSVVPVHADQSVSDAIVQAVKPYTISDWTCESCKQKGCTKQLLVASFPQVLVFHQTSVNTSISYSAILVVNQIKYALFAVVCFNGGHWWTYGRDLPPGKPWHELNDQTVRSFDANHFPLDKAMRLLMYYRLNE